MTPERAGALAVRWLPWSMLLLAAGACVITWNAPDFALIASWSVPVALVALTLMAMSPGAAAGQGKGSAAGFAAFALTLNAAALLLLIPVVVLVTKNAADTIPGWTYPFVNKRWLIALYGTALITTLVLPAFFYGLFPHEPENRPPDEDRRPSLVARLLGVIVVAALAWFVAGPPWNMARHHRAIDFHEQVHLGPLQAIDKGRMPFVGPAATQYGPGSQLLTYAYMKRSGHFTIVGFREANLIFHLAAMLVTGLVALWLIDLPSAALIMILALAFSPLSFFGPGPDGTFDGAYGWGNALRYLGALVVVPGAVIAATRVGHRRWSMAHLVFGLLWGFFAWVSQENLSSTLAAGGLAILMLALTRTMRWRQVMVVAISLVAGFALFWIPVLGVYAASGDAGEFIGNYFRVASAVAVGFSNSWWTEDTTQPVYLAYRYTPFVVIAVGLATVWDVRRLRLRHGLTPEQVRLFAFVSLLAATYLTALYRSDSSHFVNTLLPLPFVLTLAFRDLPDWSASTRARRGLVRLTVAVAAIWIYPVAPMLTTLNTSVIGPAMARRAELPAIPDVNLPDGVAFERATQYLADEALVTAGSVPMRQFLEEASELHRLIGDRKTYLTSINSVYTGLVYFMADLTPAEKLLERETMTINSLISQDVLNDYRGRARDVECVVVRDPQMDEGKIFLLAHPGARVEQRPLAGSPVFVLLAP